MNKTKELWEKVSNMNIQENVTLGPINTESLVKDPKHFAFTLSRYKFAAKMMHRCTHIIEVGCGEGIGALSFIAETNANVTAIDFDEKQIKYAQQHIFPLTEGRVKYVCGDMISAPYTEELGDGMLSLDVIEHIHPDEEEKFIKNCMASLKPGSIAIFGTPNKYAAQYASARSNEGHINLFDPQRLTSTFEKYFSHVFFFSMNDEMVHTGYSKMAHYLLVLCVNKK